MSARKISYREITGPDGYLAKRDAFQGNSMSAKYDAVGDYVVFSYETCIAAATPDGLIVYNDTKYSTTTSKHQTYVRAWLTHRV